MGRRTKTKKSELSEQIAEGPRPDEGGARRFRVWAVLIVVALAVALAAAGVIFMLAGGSGGRSQLRAAIVDQLGNRIPNPSFVENATATLKEAGYTVDYYAGDEATVELYRDLPTHDYDIVIWRAHSAVPNKDLSLPTDVDPLIIERVMSKIGNDVLLFTSQPYDGTAYLEEQKVMRLFPVVYGGDSASDTYFAISSGFVEASMRGGFDHTTIILMGCSSLASEKTAAAFVDRGAGAVIGWSDTVSPEHTDAATERLLQYLLKDSLPTAEAVEKTMAELGPDPSYGAVMRSYPSGE